MPHALSERQKEVLEFVRTYVSKNESSPRLDEISNHFAIKPPTVHKILEALQSKGYLYFGRDSVSGFFIRLIERAGSSEMVMEVAIVGGIDRYGEIVDFPTKQGHFATVLIGSKPEDVFALSLRDDIQQANVISQDIVIFDVNKKPQPGDICIAPIGERFFLVRIASKTYDENTNSLVVAQQYPIPANIENPDVRHNLNWIPLAYNDQMEQFFIQVAEEQGWAIKPISPELIIATAIRLVRQLAF